MAVKEKTHELPISSKALKINNIINSSCSILKIFTRQYQSNSKLKVELLLKNYPNSHEKNCFVLVDIVKFQSSLNVHEKRRQTAVS